MKRSDFLKTLGLFSGGIFTVSCSSDIFDDIVDSGSKDNIDVEEAKAWFENKYLANPHSARTAFDPRKITRDLLWKEGNNVQNKGNKFLWIPIKNDENEYPSILIYDEENKWKQEMGKYFSQPILEGLIIQKSDAGFSAFKAQLAYDPVSLASNGYVIDRQNFSGTLLKSDWNDNTINGVIYRKGQETRRFSTKKPNDASSRIANCSVYQVQYQYGKVENGEYYHVLATNYFTYCTGSGGGWWTSGFFDPLAVGGGGGMSYPSTDPGAYLPLNSIYEFSVVNAIQASGTDRMKMNGNLDKVVNATGVATSILGFSFDKAEMMAKVMGLEIDRYIPLEFINATSNKKFGVFSGSLSIVSNGIATYSLAVSIIEDGAWSWEDEGWNTVAVALGWGGFIGGIVFGSPWIAVATAAVTIGIFVYQETHCQDGKCPPIQWAPALEIDL